MKFEESMSASSTRYVVMSKWLTPMMFFVLLNFMIVTIYVTSGFGKRKKQLHHTLQLSRSPSMLRKLRSLNFNQFGSFNKSHDGTTGEEDYEDEKNDDVRFQHWEDEEAGDNRSMNETYRQRLEQESHIESSKLVKKNSAGSRTAFRHFREAEAMENPKMADEEIHSVHSGKNDDVYEAGQNEDDIVNDDDVFDHEEDKPGMNKSMNEVFSALQRQGSSINRTKSDTEPASGAVPVKLMKKSASTKSPFRHFREVEILEARRPATVKETKVKRAVKEEEDEDEEVDSKADEFINMFKQQLKLQRLDSNLRYKEMLDRGASR